MARRRGGETFRLEFVRCGKLACHCMKGSLGHGPYWYAYRRRGEKVTKRYVGKHRGQEQEDAYHRRVHGATPDPPPGDYDRRGRMTERAALRILGYDQPPRTLDQLRQRRARLVYEHHPDRNDSPDATAITAKINAAFDVLAARFR